MAEQSASSTGARWQRFLSVLKLILAYAVVVLSVIGVVICLVATVGVWLVRGSVQESTAAGIDRIDRGLGQAQEKLQRINAGLGTVNDATLDPGLTTLPATIVEVNSALQALNNLPFVVIPTLDTDRLQALSARVQAGLATAAGAVQSAEARTADLEVEVGAARVRVVDFGVTIRRWINLIAIALTLLLLWLALAQASLFRSAWRYTRRPA